MGRKFINVHDIISFLFSAGIGRTGTFIALDYILEEGATEQTVDVKDYVMSLRHQRGKSIQTRVRRNLITKQPIVCQ